MEKAQGMVSAVDRKRGGSEARGMGDAGDGRRGGWETQGIGSAGVVDLNKGGVEIFGRMQGCGYV